MSFPCPCCGYLTRDEELPGTYEICPVCSWQDDPVQFNDIDYQGGANDLSLREARVNFGKTGAMSEKKLKRVRPPLPDEEPPKE